MIFRTGSGNLRISVGMARNLVSASQLGIFEQIDDLDMIFTGQMFLTNLFEVRQGT
jgi:hypothetical protein